MRDSHIVAIGALVLIVIGIGLIFGATSIHIPSVYNRCLGIPYGVNPEFESSFKEMLVLFMMGTFFLGLGLGVLSSIGFVLKLEKKISQTPPP